MRKCLILDSILQGLKEKEEDSERLCERTDQEEKVDYLAFFSFDLLLFACVSKI